MQGIHQMITLVVVSKSSTNPTKCGYWGHRSFNKLQCPIMHKGQKPPHLTLSYVFSRVSWIIMEKDTTSLLGSFLLKIYEASLHLWRPLVSGEVRVFDEKLLWETHFWTEKNISLLTLLCTLSICTVYLLSGYMGQRLITGLKATMNEVMKSPSVFLFFPSVYMGYWSVVSECRKYTYWWHWQCEVL